MRERVLRIAGASGFWGDASLATKQLLDEGNIDFIVYDYLAEITMSIMARARKADPTKGYAADFVSAAMHPNLKTIKEQGVKIVSNAGGVNPIACARALRAIIDDLGLDLKVATITGDDLLSSVENLEGTTEMFSGEPFPNTDKIVSVNAYLGAYPIAKALDSGADIVITGRCVDSAVTLGACIHTFGWDKDELDKLAQASLAGHIIECGTQATGGNFTDWERVIESLTEAGYPIAEISDDANFTISKPNKSGGEVSIGTVAEQMLYEIGDPQQYFLPDVVCDFSEVRLEQIGLDEVAVSGAKGRSAPATYKTCVTWADGFRAGHVWTVIGRRAAEKARLFANQVESRSNLQLRSLNMGEFTEFSVEVIGEGSQFGVTDSSDGIQEVDVKIAAKHSSPKAVGVFLKEMIGLALTAPPGLTGFAGARAKPSPVVRLFSCLTPKDLVDIQVDVDGIECDYREPINGTKLAEEIAAIEKHIPAVATSKETLVQVPLETLAWARSGDKGDKANVGVIAREPQYLPWIALTLSNQKVASVFKHFVDDGDHVECFYLPGCHALNFLLHNALGGGGIASLRSDPQGKAYSQILLQTPISVPPSLINR